MRAQGVIPVSRSVKLVWAANLWTTQGKTDHPIARLILQLFGTLAREV